MFWIILAISIGTVLVAFLYSRRKTCSYCGNTHPQATLEGKPWCGCNKGYNLVAEHIVKRAESSRKLKEK